MTKVVACAGHKAASVKEMGWEILFKQHMRCSGVCFVIHLSTVKVHASVQTSWEICEGKRRKGNLGRGKRWCFCQYRSLR